MGHGLKVLTTRGSLLTSLSFTAEVTGKVQRQCRVDLFPHQFLTEHNVYTQLQFLMNTMYIQFQFLTEHNVYTVSVPH